jgi:hypothetical protein
MKRIKLIKAMSTENFVCRLVSDDGKIEMGIYPVIFGFRVRAGYVGDLGCNIDWCCGADHRMLLFAYNACKKLLEEKGNFGGIPPISEIKPYFKDSDFMKWLLENVPPLDCWESLPPLYEIKDEYWKMIRADFKGFI